MAGRIDRYLEQLRMRKVQERWAAAVDEATEMEPMALRAWRGKARAMRREIDRLIHVADHRLALPPLGAGLPRLPLGTDWVWRPDVWRGPVPERGAVAVASRTPVSDDVALYHDCTVPEVSLRQVRNREEADPAPFGVTMDMFGFDGSFLSLAARLPDTAVNGLRLRHLIRVDAVLEAERPVEAFARLNIKHGPNVEQLVQELPKDGRAKTVEFDLAYAKIDEKRIEKLWLDLIFERPAMNRITLRDVTVSRRPRAEL
jgi:Family of unknown function (DUF6478)